MKTIKFVYASNERVFVLTKEMPKAYQIPTFGTKDENGVLIYAEVMV